MERLNQTNMSLVDLYGASAIYKFALGESILLVEFEMYIPPDSSVSSNFRYRVIIPMNDLMEGGRRR